MFQGERGAVVKVSWVSVGCIALSALPWAAGAFDAGLRLQGGDEDLEGALRSASSVLALEQDENPQVQDVLSAARADYTRMVGALYSQGYYGPQVSIRVDGKEVADIDPLERIPLIGRVDIVVTAGPRFRFGAAQLDPLPDDATPLIEFAPGRVAYGTVIGDAALDAVEDWRDAGHAKARVLDQTVVADHNRQRLDVQTRLAPGPKLRFGAVSVNGYERMTERRVRKIASVPEGKVFSPAELDRVAARLQRSGVFRSVRVIEGDVPTADGTLPIALDLAEAPLRRFGLGAELDTSEGLGLSGFWLHRNLLGGAERLRLDAEASGIAGDSAGADLILGAWLDRPATFGADTSAFVAVDLERIDDPLFFSRTLQAQVGAARIFSDTRQAEAGIGFRLSDSEDEAGSRRFEHVIFPIAGTLDNRDDALDAAAGLYVNLEIFPYIGVSSSKSGMRVAGEARTYRALGDQTVLAFRGKLGAIFGTGIDQTPADLLFFSGGGGTVRGQPFQSLFVTNDGAETGGRSFLGLSAEVRRALRGPFGLVAFFDTGFIGSDSLPGSDGEWHSGAGLGVRYATGVGPIRLDLGIPVGGDEGGFQIYVGIGQAF